MSEGLILRRAEVNTDERALDQLLNSAPLVYRHLDWRPPLDWLGHQPFWLLEKHNRLVAAMACPADPPNVAWIRFFALSDWMIDTNEAWNELSKACFSDPAIPKGITIAALGLQPWFTDIILGSAFTHYQDIVVLEWQNQLPDEKPFPSGLLIRSILPSDLPAVAMVDQSSFEPLWQNSLLDLILALKLSDYATVAELDGQIVGYQLCTGGIYSAHLARLAVLPNVQRKSIGYALVREMLVHYTRGSISHLTVNTQNDNHASLHLYQKMGFHLTGDVFRVYIKTS